MMIGGTSLPVKAGRTGRQLEGSTLPIG